MRFFWLICLVLPSCSLTVKVEPGVDLSTVKSVSIARSAPDPHDVSQSLQRAFARVGRKFCAEPTDADVVVSFRDRWVWDFGDVLTRLDIEIKDVATGERLAQASGFWATVLRTPKQKAASELVEAVFSAK